MSNVNPHYIFVRSVSRHEQGDTFDCKEDAISAIHKLIDEHGKAKRVVLSQMGTNGTRGNYKVMNGRTFQNQYGNVNELQ